MICIIICGVSAGLWVIYPLSRNCNGKNTVVVKLEPTKMIIQYAWNISIDHG